MTDQNKDAVSDVLNGLLVAAKERQTSAYEELAESEILQNSGKCVENCDPEMFNFGLSPLIDVFKGLISSKAKNEKAEDLFLHCNFYERHFKAQIKKHEGWPCSADKSRTITKALANFFVKGEEIKFNYDQEYTYHLPTKIFTTHAEILEFFDALRNLRYGGSEKYLEALLKLQESAAVGVDHEKIDDQGRD